MSTLAHKIVSMQSPMEGEHKVNKDELDRYVRSVINSYATYQNGGLFLFADDLPREEQIIFLSRLCNAADYAWYMRSETRLTAALNEYQPQMQLLLVEALPSVWADVQDEIDDWKQRKFYGTDSFAECIETLPQEPSGRCHTWRIN